MVELGGIENIMDKSYLWEKKGQKYACRICGQYIQNKEKYILVVTPTPYRKDVPNFIVHTDEWDKFKENVEDIDSLMIKIINTKQPKAKNATAVDENVVTAFKKVLSDNRYQIKKETKTRIYFKTSSKMASFYFDKRFKEISFEGRTNGLFDGLFLKELYARLHESLNKELGIPVIEGFRMNKALNEAVDTVNKLIN